MKKQPTFSHDSHGQADRAGHHAPNLARNGAPKRVVPVAIHPGMTTQTKSGGEALGGDHKSAVDSLSGLVTVPGKHGGESVAHPLVKPPVAKRLAPVAPYPGQKSQTNMDCETHADKCQHGADMLAQAVKR